MNESTAPDRGRESAPPLPAQAVVEMLRRELDASKSVGDHLQFLERVAGQEPMSDAMRQHLVTHIRAEEAEHQQHLARLIPIIEDLMARLGDAEPPATTPEVGLTVGSLIGKRPWHATSSER